jgi:DNA-binding transcriptional ArsR family regulator
MSPRSSRATSVAEAAPLFAALGDETRLKLVDRLSAGGPLPITRLTAGSGVTRQAVTKHLTILAGAGLVRDFRRGRERIWQLESRRLVEARRRLDEISQRWDAALDRLKKFVED